MNNIPPPALDADAAERAQHQKKMERRFERLDVLRRLLDGGGDPNWADFHGTTAAMESARLGYVECLILLADRGANLLATDPHGQGLGFYAVEGGCLECLSFLAERGGFSQVADNGQTCALHAVTHDNAEALRFIADHGANLSARNHRGRSPILEAAAEGRLDCLRFLADRGISLEERDGRHGNSWSLAELCVRGGHLECLRFLAERGVKFDAISHTGLSLAQLARSKPHRSNCAPFIETRLTVQALEDAAGPGQASRPKIRV